MLRSTRRHAVDRKFPVEEWHGFLFTNLVENPPPLATRLEPLERMIRNCHMGKTKVTPPEGRSLGDQPEVHDRVFRGGNHFSPLHRTTPHWVNPTRLCRHYPAGDAYFGYNVGYVPELPRSTTGHPDLTEVEAHNCVMFAVPPGLV